MVQKPLQTQVAFSHCTGRHIKHVAMPLFVVHSDGLNLGFLCCNESFGGEYQPNRPSQIICARWFLDICGLEKVVHCARCLSGLLVLVYISIPCHKTKGCQSVASQDGLEQSCSGCNLFHSLDLCLCTSRIGIRKGKCRDRFSDLFGSVLQNTRCTFNVEPRVWCWCWQHVACRASGPLVYSKGVFLFGISPSK